MCKVSALALVLALFATAAAAENGRAAWTVLVWMNGDNNLEKEVSHDWVEMALAPPSDRVNVVVQLDLFNTDGTYRLKVKSDKKPRLPSKPNLEETNMVDGAELEAFVRWGMCEYPADHYALVFSSHGSGPRKFTLDSETTQLSSVASPATEEIELPGGVFNSPSRALSADNHSPGDYLYNSEMAVALEHALPQGKKLDLIGFDACLMSMTELIYGLRRSSEVLVASEELIHADGWNYTDWLTKLIADPSMDGEKLAATLVDSYAAAQKARNDPGERTLAAFRTSRAEDLAHALSKMADAVVAAGDEQFAIVQSARAKCAAFAPTSCGPLRCFHHIDLKRLADLVAGDGRATLAVKSAAEKVASLIASMRIANYAGALRSGDDPARVDYGSEGLAIYFPATGKDFTEDKLTGSAYMRGATVEWPIEFVDASDVHWSDFLQRYYKALARKQ